MEEIRVIVDTEGEIQISTHGFKGRSCLAATKDLEEALGVTVSDRPTPEFHQEAEDETRNYARR